MYTCEPHYKYCIFSEPYRAHFNSNIRENTSFVNPIRDIKYMDWKRFRNLRRVPENHPCCASELDGCDEFAVDSDEYYMDADPSGRVSGV